MNTEQPIDTKLSPRVNAARLTDFVGKHVRLPCKALKDGQRMIVEASDGGQVTVELSMLRNPTVDEPYLEVIGLVSNASTIQMKICIPLGNDLDMKLVNDTIELMHDRRFYTKMFS